MDVPLPVKLGVRPGMSVALDGAPPGFRIAGLPEGAEVVGSLDAPADVVLLFVAERAALGPRFAAATAVAGPQGAVWVAWPKRSSGVRTDVTEDVLREELLPTGWVDVKVCAISPIWSGLRFVRRRGRPADR